MTIDLIGADLIRFALSQILILMEATESCRGFNYFWHSWLTQHLLSKFNYNSYNFYLMK